MSGDRFASINAVGASMRIIIDSLGPEGRATAVAALRSEDTSSEADRQYYMGIADDLERDGTKLPDNSEHTITGTWGRPAADALAAIAVDIALEAPLSGTRPTTQVTRDHIKRVRDVLEQVGFDWRAFARRRKNSTSSSGGQ